MGQHKFNPIAIAAKNEELPPKTDKISKHELQRLLYFSTKVKMAEKTGLADYILNGFY